MEIRHGAVVDNVVTNVYAKFGNSQLWNEKALADRKSDNNNRKKNNNNNKNTFVAIGDPFPGPKTDQSKVKSLWAWKIPISCNKLKAVIRQQ